MLLDFTYSEVHSMIKSGELEAKKYGAKYIFPRDDITWFLFQQKLEEES